MSVKSCFSYVLFRLLCCTVFSHNQPLVFRKGSKTSFVVRDHLVWKYSRLHEHYTSIVSHMWSMLFPVCVEGHEGIRPQKVNSNHCFTVQNKYYSYKFSKTIKRMCELFPFIINGYQHSAQISFSQRRKRFFWETRIHHERQHKTLSDWCDDVVIPYYRVAKLSSWGICGLTLPLAVWGVKAG